MKISIGCGDMIVSIPKNKYIIEILLTQYYENNDYKLSIDLAQQCCEDFEVVDNFTNKILDGMTYLGHTYHDKAVLEIIEKDDQIDITLTAQYPILDISVINIHNGYYPHFVKLEKISREEVYEGWI